MTLDYRSQSDIELIGRAYSGDKEAFSELYSRYLTPVFQYIYYRVANQHDAEDLTESVFVKAWEALPQIQLSGFNFKAWIYRIARNNIVDRFRTQHPSDSLDDASIISDPDENPEAVFQASELTDQLTQVISKLDPDMQDVILYRFMMGLSHAETAAIMNRSLVYVRVLQHRALKKMRMVLKREISEND